MKFIFDSTEKYGPDITLDENTIKKIFKLTKLNPS